MINALFWITNGCTIQLSQWVHIQCSLPCRTKDSILWMEYERKEGKDHRSINK